VIETLALSGYRSLKDLLLPMSQLTVVTGANGSGKSSLYNALQLLAEAARGNVVAALALQGGLPSTLWAGPEKTTRAMELGEVPVKGGPRQRPVRLQLGFTSQDYGYLIELGMPVPIPGGSAFDLDPVIKRESIWNGKTWRQASLLIDRKGALLKRRSAGRWHVVSTQLSEHDSLFSHAGDPSSVPEMYALRGAMRQWRFYSDFRTDPDAPARQSRPATRTPVLHHDGRDLAAALQTIREVGDSEKLDEAIDDAFPGSRLVIESYGAGRLDVHLQQPGLLRLLDCPEWSDGTLRYILLVAALLTPRPPTLMVLNEPETSLHPDLLPALARLIIDASERSQVWVVSHANRLVNALDGTGECSSLMLEKSLGQTSIAGLRELDKPLWRWG